MRQSSAFGSLAQAAFDECPFSQSSCGEDVWARAAVDQQSRHWFVGNEILQWCGRVVDIAGLEVCTLIDEELRNVTAGRAMKHCLAVAATIANYVWLGCNDRLQLVQHSQTGGRPCGDRRTALDERLRLLRIYVVLENPKRAGRPRRARGDIRPMCQQHIYERDVVFRLM